MNFLILEQSELDASNEVKFTGVRARNLAASYPISLGGTLRGGLVGGLLGEFEVLEYLQEQIVLKFTAKSLPPPRIPVVLVVAVPRPQAIKKILLFAASYGIEALHFVRTARVDKSYMQSRMLRPEDLHATLMEGLCQSGDTVLPIVERHDSLNAFLNTCDQIISPTMRFVCVADKVGISRLDEFALCAGGARRAGSACILIGSELGFLDSELQALYRKQFTGISLGPRILRVENAVCLAVGELGIVQRLAPV